MKVCRDQLLRANGLPPSKKTFPFAIRGDREPTEGVRVFVKDTKGAAGVVALASILPGGKLSRRSARAAVPTKELKIDWASWASFGLEFTANTWGVIHINDVEVACGN